MLGMSFVYVIFEERTDLYWARSRVLESLSSIAGRLPQGVTPTLGPDATGIGWVFQYALVDKSGKHGLDELRTFQDFTLRYALGSVPGVAEVASIGGYQKQYQVTVDPKKLAALGVTMQEVTAAIRDSNNDVGGRVIEMSGREYYVRGRGYIQDLGGIERIVLRAPGRAGAPILIKDVATVRFGPEIRRGLLEWNGEGEAVGAIVAMRHGENAVEVIARVKKKLAELEPSLPRGVKVEIAYDRSALIERSIDTLTHALLEEALVVSLVIIGFLLHFRSALLPIVSLPISVALAFIPMYLLGIPSTIMSLGGIAIAIGATVDDADRHKLLAEAAREVTPAIFFSLLIIAVSFLPVLGLTGQAGRLFRPLAYTKTFVMLSAALLSITFAPALRDLLIRGRIVPEHQHPVSRFLIKLRGAAQPAVDGRHRSARGHFGRRAELQARPRVHAAPERRRHPLHADHVPEHLDRRGQAAAADSGPHPEGVSRGLERLRQGRPCRDCDGPRPAHDGGDDGAAQACRAVATHDAIALVLDLGAGFPQGRAATDLA
jgi:Cu(I)/Ag(I) efflux system membrane protein CusA/SilA